MPQPPISDSTLRLCGVPNSVINGSAADKSSMYTPLKEALREERLALDAFLEERHCKLVSRMACCLPNSVEFSLEVGACPTQHCSVLSIPEMEVSGIEPSSKMKRSQSQSVRLAVEGEDEEAQQDKGASGQISRVLNGENSYKQQISEPSIGTVARSVATISVVDREIAVRRLQARLGYLAPGNRVTADQIYHAVQTLSLENVKLADIKMLVCSIRAATDADLHCEVPSLKGPISSLASSVPSPTAGFMREALRGASGPSVAFHSLVDVLIASPESLEDEFGPQVAQQLAVIKDALLSPDADCLVAEIMCLRVDDISAPIEPATCLEMMEPFVGGVIMLNGVFIGIQTDTEFAELQVMIFMEVLFTCFFLTELFIKLRITGCMVHFLGDDRYWNWFDFLAVTFAVLDVTISLLPVANDVDTNTITILRLARLTRLTRLVRIFRLQCLKELTLMVKGLLGGLRTLSWAVVLLFFTLYVIGIFLTLMLGQPGSVESAFEYERELYFSTLPKSMFTSFRCLLIVDCAASNGKPLLTILTNKYGWIVPVVYSVCFIVVSIGLMNLIMAIYIENTLNNAKFVDDRNKAARNRESFRVARQLKRLLVIVCNAQQALTRRTKDSLCSFSEEIAFIIEGKPQEHEKTDLTVEVTRDCFMLVLQHPVVQKLLDDLDISPERANLFDVLDADSSGHLLPTELVNGLLKCRGETRRGDVVAALLAIRDLQSHVRRMEDFLFSGAFNGGQNRRSLSRTSLR